MNGLLIKDNGDIKYFTLFKIGVLIALFYAFISKILDTHTTTISNASGTVLVITFCLLMIQYTIYNVYLLFEILKMINYHFIKYQSNHSYYLKYYIKEKIYLTNHFKKVDRKIYLRLNVIRC